MQYIGKISFEIYLVHGHMIFTLQDEGGKTSLETILWIVIMILLSIALNVIMERIKRSLKAVPVHEK